MWMNVTGRRWLLEVLYLLGTGIVALLVMLPIIESGIDFPWLIYNSVFLVGALTLVRYIFYFDRHPLARSKVFKILMICSIPILFFPIIEGLHSFIEFNDREGIASLLGHLNYSKQDSYSRYIRVEYLLAGVTCFIGSFALIIKMIRSLWRQVKYGQV